MLLQLNEEIKSLLGYEGLYSITSFGRIWSHEKVRKCGRYAQRILKARFLKLKINKKGYLDIDLYKESNKKRYQVHRLVAQHYIPNLLNLPQVNHKDANKQNNYKDNLEWCTNQENQNHASINKLYTHKKYSKYYGVSFHIGIKYKNKPWSAQVKFNEKQKYIGMYKTELEAAGAYNIFVIENNLDRLLNNLGE